MKDFTYLTLQEILPILVSPITKKRLIISNGVLKTFDKLEKFPFIKKLPVLYPSNFLQFLGKNSLEIPFDYYQDPLLQYCLINSIKQNGWENNSDHSSPWYQKHLKYARKLLKDAKGVTLDVGCDEPEISAKIFHNRIKYIGLDPLFENKELFRIIGMAEFLPFSDQCIDNICFLSSLDHVFDYHKAIEEAYRLLKPNGKLYLCSLIWQSDAELYKDHVHFHHFRESQLLDCLKNFEISDLFKTGWKNEKHRKVVYLCAVKK